jgi:hypothetical protein
MDLFLSWSGNRSKLLAGALFDWLPRVVQGLRPHMLTSGRGTLEQPVRSGGPGGAVFAIPCVTAENWDSPWLAFEVGALSHALRLARIAPLLLDVSIEHVSGPLSVFQLSIADKPGLQRIVLALNDSLQNPHPKAIVWGSFDKYWPEFSQTLEELRNLSEIESEFGNIPTKPGNADLPRERDEHPDKDDLTFFISNVL